MIHGSTQCSINVQTSLLRFAGGKGFLQYYKFHKGTNSTQLHRYWIFNLKMAQEKAYSALPHTQANGIIIYAVSFNAWFTCTHWLKISTRTRSSTQPSMLKIYDIWSMLKVNPKTASNNWGIIYSKFLNIFRKTN